MFKVTRKRVAAISSGFTIALVLVLGPAAFATGPVVHHVTAGGPDACVFFGFEHPGCDGNFSLVAHEYADGSVSGQYTDRFRTGRWLSRCNRLPQCRRQRRMGEWCDYLMGPLLIRTPGRSLIWPVCPSLQGFGIMALPRTSHRIRSVSRFLVTRRLAPNGLRMTCSMYPRDKSEYASDHRFSEDQASAPEPLMAGR